MFMILAIMFLGVALGYLIRRWGVVRYIGATTMITILLLLFVMGSEVGRNEHLLANLVDLGGQALLIAVAGVSGSIVAAKIVYQTLFKGGADGK